MNMKYFYKTIKSSLFLFLALFFATSCEEYLEEQPSTKIDSDYIYTTEEGLKSGVVSLYKFNRDFYRVYEQDFFSASLMGSRSDLAFNRTGYLGLFGRYERGVSPIQYSAGLLSKYFWKHYYKITSKATEIINAAEIIEGIDENVKNKVIAEAKYFRANTYFTLYRMFNNIFVSTKSITVDNAFDLIENKSSEEEIFALINSDLSFAIDHLEWTSEFGQVTKGTAKHVKAKVAMWQGDWAEAKMQSETLINEGPHSLVSSTSDVFKQSMNHTEQLFVVQFKDDISGGGFKNMISANYLVKYWTIDNSDSKVSYGGKGFSRILPNNYLLDLLAEDPEDDRGDNNYFRLKYYYDSGSNSGEEIDIYEPITDLANPSPTYKKYYEKLHPACLKYTQEDNDPNSYWQISNIMVYRLAETYLIAAEANMRGGGDPLPYINAVRARAGATDLTNVDQQVILDERARELAFEGQRWFTLKRMGLPVLRHQITTYAGDGEYYPSYFGGAKDPRENWQDHYINFPIPQRDLDLMGSGYPQNLGYE